MKIKQMKRAKARKTYQCKGCGDTINPGEYYTKDVNSDLADYGLDQPRFFWVAYKIHYSQDCYDKYWKMVKTLAQSRCAERAAALYHEHAQERRF